MAETRKVYSKEFKQKAVELSNVRGSTQEIAEELGVRAELIYRWRREMKSHPDLAFSGNGKAQFTPEQKDLAKLKRELADVKMERAILKKGGESFFKTLKVEHVYKQRFADKENAAVSVFEWVET